jgi:hypothetical protein
MVDELLNAQFLAELEGDEPEDTATTDGDDAVVGSPDDEEGFGEEETGESAGEGDM